MDLLSAMKAGDVLAEAERRYELIAGAIEAGVPGTELKALSIEADKLIEKIGRLRAEREADAGREAAAESGRVVKFDAGRFRKSG